MKKESQSRKKINENAVKDEAFDFVPGNWFLDEGNDVVSDFNTEGDIICLAPSNWPESMKNWKGNSHLIIAAPDLLYACKSALEDGKDYPLSGAIIRVLQRAIKKAEGGESE